MIENDCDHRDVHLPDISPVAAFTFRGRCRVDEAHWVSPAAFTGLRDGVRLHDHRDGHAVVVATFTPIGAHAFLRAPLEEFAGHTVDLAGFLGSRDELERLQDNLAHAPDHSRRILLIEEHLLKHLHASAPDPLIHAAIDWLLHDPAGARIDALTAHIGLSQSALERRFRRVVGLTPKRFASICRLREAVRLRMGGADFTTAAVAAGYFDQPHFIKEFRRATGRSPEAFLRDPTSA